MARILVVEDNADFQLLLTVFLTHAGHKVTAADTADQARSRLSEQEFDLLLLAAAKCYAAWIMPYLPPCLLRSVTGFLCPACGMTHSVFALTRLDLITALKENALMPALVLLGLLRYAELWCAVCGRPRTIIPRRAWFWFSFGGACFLYVLLRNVFL